MRTLWKVLLSFALFGFTTFATAEDAYHENLRLQLQSDFGISGGQWLLSDTEKNTNAKASLSSVTRKSVDYSGDLPFSKILELTTTSRKNNAWDSAVRFTTSGNITKDDALLLVVWLNSVESDADVNHITHIFELTSSPYTKSLNVGGDAKEGWRQWLLPFKAEMDYSAGNGRYQINMGHMAGTIQVAGIAVINFGDKYAVEDLPQTTFHLDYRGREDGAQWRVDALQRIEQSRKGDFRVRVVNKNDQPVKNARVALNMRRHDFGFGTAISTRWWLQNLADSDAYLDKLQDLTGDGRSFNVVVFENALKWPTWENNNSLGSPDQVAEVVDWLKSNNIRVRGHNLVWPKWDHLPNDLEAHKSDPDYIRTRIHEHIDEEAGWDGIKGMIDEWDVINEMVHCTDLRDLFGTEEIYADWLKWTAQADSNATLYLNEYSIINGGGSDLNSQTRYKEIIQNALDQDAPLAGLGIQGHMGANFTPPEKVVQILQDFSSFGLDLSITEYDASGADEEIAGDYMRDLLIAAFSVPQVRNFLMWGFWDGSHWHKDAPMFRRDWSIKPGGEAFINWVFHTWWTNEQGATTRDGRYAARAFYGLYEVTAEFDGKQATAEVHFDKNSGETVLKIDTELTSVQSRPETPKRFELGTNFPNPFNPQTTILFSLPRQSHVQINVLDVRGRLVASLIDEARPAGHYTVRFNGARLASGVYYAHMHAGDFDVLKKMLLIK